MEETHAADTGAQVKLPVNEDAVVNEDERVLINGDAHIQREEGNKEDSEEETALDGAFIKIDKESIDVKESSQTQETKNLEESSSSSTNVEPETLGTNSEIEELIKAHQTQVEVLTKKLQQSESEKMLLKSDADSVKEKLERMDKHCEELELDQKQMKEQIAETEQEFSLQIRSLEEALGAADVKHKELGDVKEAFNELSSELDSSRKKTEQLEVQLASSADEARKFQELSGERSSHAELETKRALDFESLLEAEKLSAKEMENQMANLQDELKALYDKLAENQEVEEVLSKTSTELAGLQEKFEQSVTQVADLEQKLVSQEATVEDLTQELSVHKISNEQISGDLHALETLYTACKEDLQAKKSDFEKVELKLQEEMKARETIESSLEDLETQKLSILDELQKVTKEKETLQNTVADLNENLSLTKELFAELEVKLDLADQRSNGTDSLLSQALSDKEGLEEKVKSFEGLHIESRSVAESSTQRSLELESLVEASKAAEEKLKEELKETQKQLVAAEEQNLEIEKQLSLAELKNVGAGKEIKTLNEKTSELTTLLKGIEEENALSRCQFQAYDDRVSQLESSLKQSYLKNSELQEELLKLSEASAEHEGRATETHQRSIELEELIQISHSKAEDAGNKVSEFELLLEAANQRTQELEVLLSGAEDKYNGVQVETEQLNSKLSLMSAELEVYHSKSAGLEAMLQAANETEVELTGLLNVVTEERKQFEDVSIDNGEKLLQTEKIVEVLQSELKSAHDKLGALEKDLEIALAREHEILEKLKVAEEQLEHHERAVEQANARVLDLEASHEALTNDSGLKLQEATASFTQKDSEAKQLLEKLTSLEEQTTIYQDQANRATGEVSSLKAELGANEAKISALLIAAEDLKTKISESETNAEKSILENDMLASRNSKLQEELVAHQAKVNELHELLSSIQAEKDATAEQLASHVNAISKLTDDHSRGLELQSTTESRIRETEVQLHEAIERFARRDIEAKDLHEKLLELEDQVRLYEEQVNEVVSVSENRKLELEAAILKSQKLDVLIEELRSKVTQFETENDGLASANLRLSEELAAYETKMSALQAAMDAVIAEKENTATELHGSRKTIEDLTQQLAFEVEKLQSQISTVMEENNMLTQMHQDAKRELEAMTFQMEEQINDHKTREISLNADVESFKTELDEKPLMQAQISELKQQLVSVETKYAEELESLHSVVVEKETVLTSKLEEHTSILTEKDVLNEQLKELKRELELAQNTLAEQKELISRKEAEQDTIIEKSADEAELDSLKLQVSQTAELEKKVAELENELANTKRGKEAKDVEVNSRDFDFGTSTLSKRKSKKRSEGVNQTTETIAADKSITAEPSGPMAFKFILAVALVSVIIGIVLGKRY